MAPRFMAQTELPDFKVPVVLDIDRSLVHLEDPELRSPGMTKPMKRTYVYVRTPEDIGMGAAMQELAPAAPGGRGWWPVLGGSRLF